MCVQERVNWRGWEALVCVYVSQCECVVLAAERLTAFIFICWLAFAVLPAGTAMLYFPLRLRPPMWFWKLKQTYRSFHISFSFSSLSLSLCSDSVFCLAPSLTVPHVQMPGWVSLWHLTNSITICSICPLHFEWWYSHQRSLFIEQLSKMHTYTCMICNRCCASFLFLCKNEPLVTLN